MVGRRSLAGCGFTRAQLSLQTTRHYVLASGILLKLWSKIRNASNDSYQLVVPIVACISEFYMEILVKNPKRKQRLVPASGTNHCLHFEILLRFWSKIRNASNDFKARIMLRWWKILRLYPQELSFLNLRKDSAALHSIHKHRSITFCNEDAFCVLFCEPDITSLLSRQSTILYLRLIHQMSKRNDWYR